MTLEEFCSQHEDHREETEERSAIMEIDGGVNRETADKEAMRRIKWKYGLLEQEELF